MTTSIPAPAPANVGQADVWNGAAGSYWAAQWQRFDRSVAAYDDAFLSAARIEPESIVLDIGCGTGATTRAAGRRATRGHAVGVDLSADMLDVARRLTRTDRLTNVSFEHGDAQVHPFPAGRFDRAVSRAGAMFFAEPVNAFGHISRALRPRSRLVLLTWQPPVRNEWISEFSAALLGRREPPVSQGPGPFSMSDPGVVRAILTDAGFRDVLIRPVTAPMVFGPNVEEAHRFVAGLFAWMLRERTPREAQRRLDALHATMARHLTADGVAFGSAGWLATATWPR